MEKIYRPLIAAIVGCLIASSALTAFAQTDTPALSPQEERDRSIWMGVFDIGIPWSADYWSFWSGEGDPIDMVLAESPEAIRQGRTHTVTRTGKGLRYEPIGNDGVAGLVAYGVMRDPADVTKRWIKIEADDAFTWFRLPRSYEADTKLISLPPYGSGALINRTIELAETAGGPTASRVFAPSAETVATYGANYGFAEILILDTETVTVPPSEQYWDTGLEPEASAPKNVWVKVQILDSYTQYNEMPFSNPDAKVLGEGWMRLFGPDGSYQISYSPKGC